MADVQIDISDGAMSSHDIVNGYDITRAAVVWNLNGGGTRDTAQMLYDAEQAVIAITGDRGSQYTMPGSGVKVYLKHFRCKPLGAFAAKVDVIYRGYALARYEFDGSLNNVPTNQDVNGNPIQVSYTYPKDYTGDPLKAGLTETQGFEDTVPIPESLFSIKYIVTAGTVGGVAMSATGVLTYIKKLMEGKINKVAYPVGEIPGGVHCVLCEKVHGTSNDGGQSYDMTVTFHYRPTSWDKTYTFVDPCTKQPEPDATLGNGMAKFQRIPEATFLVWTFGPN